MPDYAKLASNTTKTIRKNGRPLTVTYTASREYDPTTNEISSGTGSSKDTYGVVTEFKRSQIDGQNIKRGDKQVLIAAEGLDDITQDSQIILDDGYWNVVDVQTVQPAEIAILHKVQIRK